MKASIDRIENAIIENTGKESGYMRCLLWESMRCQMRAKQSQKQNGLRVLAAAFVVMMTITMIPVTEVQAASYSGKGFDVSSYNGVVD